MITPITYQSQPILKLLLQRTSGVFLFLLLQFSICYSQDIYVSGPDSVCFSGIYTFTLENADPSIVYEWEYSTFGFGLSPFNYFIEDQTNNTIEIDIYSVGGTGIRTLQFCAFESGGFNDHSFCKTFIFFPTPQDMLVFPADICDMNDNLLPYDLRYVDRYVCLGDTTNIGVAHYETSKETILPNQIFTPDRLILNNGQLVDYDDYNFRVVWDELGSKPIRLKTTNVLGCISTLSADVIVMDVSPIPIISENDQSEPLIVCIDENISLSADASISSALKWQVSDGRVFTNKEINLSFDEPGTYEIELNEISECSCSSASFKTIIVEEGESPQIECTGTTCAGEEVTYYSSSFCDQYIWSISPEGSIIEGGAVNDNYITVVWNTSPQGNISLTTPGCFTNACKESVNVNIPIIDNNVEITGKQLACFGETIEYSVPAFDGTNYTWNVASFYGTIVSGQGTNSILVRWKTRPTENGPTNVSVFYENCFIDCQGNDNHDVEILPPMNIYYTEEPKCKDASLIAITRYSIIADWEVTAPDNTSTTYSSLEKLDIILSQVGNYKILLTAAPGTTCNDTYQFEVLVSPDPSPPVNIQESQQVCEGANIQYSIPGLGTFDIVHWAVYDGDLVSSAYSSQSKTLNYEWQSSGPYRIRAKIENSRTGCISEATIFDLQNNSELYGTAEVCTGLEGTYHISIPQNSSVDWSIIPDNVGSIIKVTNDSLYILWNVPGTYEIHAEVCGIAASIFTTVVPEIDLGIDATPMCPDEIFQLTGTVPIDVSLEVLNDNDSLIGSTIPLSLGEGFYTIFASNIAGCQYEEEIEIIVLDVPKVRVSSPQPNVYCQTIPFPITIVVDTDGTYTFEWFRNNISLGQSGTSITTTDFGMYYVIVTDSNGCSSQSNIHTIREDCGTATPVNFSLINLDCNNLVFEVDPPYSSTNFTWFFDDPDSGPNNVVSGLSVSHEFTYAGYYYVIVNGNANEAGADIIEIGTVANFEFMNGCAGSPIAFTNLSTYIPGFDSSNNLWNFGDPSSGGDNSSTANSPVHIYNTPGSYTVTLQTIDVNGCISISEKIVTIYDDPSIAILSRDRICKDLVSSFGASVYSDEYDYSWNFDDPTSGLNNQSYDYITTHVFSGIGFYTVTLEVRDKKGCNFIITKQIEVVDNTLEGEISGDRPLPKCPEETITLTAPLALEYIWSNGATSSSISISEEGYYSVTVTNDAGCSYSPPGFDVYSVDLYSTRIIGKKRQADSSGSQVYFDSLVVCEGEEFDLFTNELPNIIYQWSTSETDTKLFYEDYFTSISIGSYDYTLLITEVGSGCTILHNYRIIVNPLPVNPTISTDQTGNCEGILHTLSVNDPIPDILYRWQYGRIGTSIQTRSAGTYFVEAINNQGCIAESNPIVISTIPSNIGWMTGCKEVCFPNEFCLTLSEQYTYSLYKNDSFVSSINASASDLEIDSPGDYNLVVASADGCEIETGKLTLSALDNDQKISGIVFFDENNNGLFDGNDVLLENVIVNLLAGNTILETITTDGSGMYDFSDFEGANHQISIDVSGLDYSFEGATDSLFIFENCIDVKGINFPLISDCFIATTRMDSLVCAGSSVIIDGVDYNVGDVDTLVYNINENCDSIVIISITEPLVPIIDPSLTSSCKGDETGEILITIVQGDNLRYSIDESNDTTSLSVISGISPGPHILYIHNETGCTYQYPFEIQEVQAPEIEMSTQQSCKNEATGSVSIEVMTGDNLTFCIDGLTFSQQDTFTDLTSGEYTITIKDNNGCEYSYPIEITDFPQPEYSISQQDACDGQPNGSIDITIENGAAMMFSLNTQLDWTLIPNYDLLDSGSYILYSQSEFGCINSMPFTIGSIMPPTIVTNVTSACENLAGGTIDISTSASGVLFSLDGISFSSNPILSDIPPGSHILYYQSMEGCIFESVFEITQEDAPVVDIISTPTCLQGNNGIVNLSVISGTNLQFSIDGIVFSENLQFDGLPTGNNTLFVTNDAGCEYQFPFTVLNLPAPEVEINTIKTCKGLNDGNVAINIIAGTQLQFSLDDQNYGTEVSYSTLTGGGYNLYVLDSLGCEYQYPFVIEEFDSPELLVEINNACEANLTGSIFIESLNNVDAQFAIDNQNNWFSASTIENLEIGEHTLYSLSEFGCIDSLQLIIEVVAEPMVEIDIKPECENNENGLIDVSSDSPGIMYSLDGIDFTDENTFGELPFGDYTLYFITQEGCILERPFEIELLPSPSTEVELKHTCIDEESGAITIENINNEDLLYSLDGSPFSQEFSFENLPAGQYIIEIQNEFGCTYGRSASILETPLPVLNLEVDNSCYDQDNGTLMIETEQSNDVLINGETTQEFFVDNLIPGEYSIIVKDSIGCEAQDFITIDELPILDVFVPTFDLDCYENEVTIIPEIRSSSGTVEYQWHNGSTEKQLTSISSGNHSVTISDDCSVVEYEWDLSISAQIGESLFFAPNIFSPNNDGVNDCFKITANPLINITSYKLMVFDRWGNLFFNTNDISDCWDGRYNIDEAVPGVYVYILEIGILQCEGLITFRSIGDVTVFR